MRNGRIAAFSRLHPLAWIAVFALQLGMLTCAVGIDPCHAASQEEASLIAPDTAGQSAPAQDAPQPASLNDEHGCAAHAAHTFIDAPEHRTDPEAAFGIVRLRAAPVFIPDIPRLIEQPPKLRIG